MNDKELLESLIDTLSEIMSRYDDCDGIMRAVDRSGYDIPSELNSAKTLLECLP